MVFPEAGGILCGLSEGKGWMLTVVLVCRGCFLGGMVEVRREDVGTWKREKDTEMVSGME